MDDQECLPTTTNIRNHGQDQSFWSQIFHQIRCSMGIQQCTHQGWQSMESGIQDQPWIIWTNGHVLWTMQFPFNISSNDEQHPQRWNQRGILHHIHIWTTSSFSPRTKKISNASPNAFLKASEKPTSTSNHQNANFAKWRLNILALLSKKAKWWWTPQNSMESVTGQSPRTSNKYVPSLDLETFIDASFRNSPNSPNPWTNSSRKTNLSFRMMPLNKPSMKWRNASPKNLSSWCWIRHNPSRLNVMHWNMHLAQSLCNSTSMVIDTHVPSYHRPSPWWNRIMKSMIASSYQWSELSRNGDTIFKDPHMKQQSIQTTKTSHISEAPRSSINDRPDGPSFYLIWHQTGSSSRI